MTRPLEQAVIGSRLRWLLVASLLFAWAPFIVLTAEESAEDAESDSSEAQLLERVAGTVTQVGNFGFGLVPDAEPGTRYAPNEPLPDEFQHDGLKVRFSGVVGDPDESAGRGRRWGTPLEVTHIERQEESHEEHGNKGDAGNDEPACDAS